MADIVYSNSNGIPLQETLGFNVGYKEQTPELQRTASAGQFIGGVFEQFKAEYVTLRTALELNQRWGEGWRVVDVQKQDVPGGSPVDSVTIAYQLNDVSLRATITGSVAPKANSPANVITLSGSSISWEITGTDLPGIPQEGSEEAIRFSALLAGTTDRWSLDFIQDDPKKIYFNDNFTTSQNPASTVSGAALLGAFMLPMAPPSSGINADRFQRIVRERVNGDDANEIDIFNATAASPFQINGYRAGSFSQFPYADPLSVGGKYYSLREVLDQWSKNHESAPLSTQPALTAPRLDIVVGESRVPVDISKFVFNPTSGTDAQIESFAKHVVNTLNALKSTNTTIQNLLADGRLALETNGLLHITNSPQAGMNNPTPLVVYKKTANDPDSTVISFDTRDSARFSGALDGITLITGLDTEKTTTTTVISVQNGVVTDAPSVGEIKSLNFTSITGAQLQQGKGLISVSMQSASERSPIVVTLELTKTNNIVYIAGTTTAASAQNLAAAFVDKFNAQAEAWAARNDKPYIPLIAYATSQLGEVRLAFNSAFGDVRGSLATNPTNNDYDPVNDIVLRNADGSVVSTNNAQPVWSIKPVTIQNFSGKPSDITFPDTATLGIAGVARTSGAFSLDVTRMDAALPATSSEIRVTGTSQFIPLNSLPVDGGIGQMFRGNDGFTITDSIGTVVAAGNGNDTVIGGAGDDVVEGGGGNDNLSGANGDDIFVANKGYVFADQGRSGTYAYTDSDSRSGNTTTPSINVGLPGGTSAVSLSMLQSTVINGGQGLDTLLFEEGLPQRLQLILPSAYQMAPEAHTLKFNASAAANGSIVVTLPHLFPAPLTINITRGESAAAIATKVVAAFNGDPWFKNGYGADRVAFIDPADSTRSTVKFQYVYADGNVAGTPSVQIIDGAITARTGFTVTGDVAPTFNVPGSLVNSSQYAGYIGTVTSQPTLGRIFAEPVDGVAPNVFQGISLPVSQAATSTQPYLNQLGFKFTSTWKDIESDQLGTNDYAANEYYRVSDVEFIQAKPFAYTYDTASITANRTGAAILTVRLAAIDTPIDVVITATETRSEIAAKILTQIQTNPEFVSKGWKAYISPEDLTTVKIIFAPDPVTSSQDSPPRVSVSSNAATLPVSVNLQPETIYREGTELIDIRPLYLATSGNDTLYAFNRAGFEALEQVIDRSDRTGYWLADDPLALFDSNFVGKTTDSYYFLAGGAGDDRLIGTGFTDDSSGNRGRDILDGGEGNDTMIGGAGNDVYYVDSVNDIVVESLADDRFIFDDPTGEFNGYDTVIVRNNYALQAGNSVERLLVHNLYLQNYASNNASLANPNTQYRLTPNTGTGSAVNINGSNYTVELAGHDGANNITAGSMAGMLSGQMSYYGGALLLGMGGNDTLTGGDGNDRLFGGVGNDALLGGAGNDFFYMGFGSDRLGLDLDGTDDPTSWTSPNKELNAYSLLREWGLDDQNATHDLTGGNDTVTGGSGVDTIVIGSGPNAEPVTDRRFDSTTQNDFFGKVNFERFFDSTGEKIRISTPFAESMVVDSSVELVRFSNGDLFLLPWTSVLIDGRTVQLRDEKARDAYVKSVLDSVEPGSVAADWEGALPAFVYMPASSGADFVDLRLQNASDAISDFSLTGGYFYPSTSWDGLAGDDIIYAGSQYHRILGGLGNDWIYSSGFHADVQFQSGTAMYRQELYGDAGDDTFTANLGEFTSSSTGVSSSTLLMDGGAGNDTYRLSLIGQALDPNFKLEINDSVTGTAVANTLVLAVNDDSKLLPYYDPASGTFRLMYADRRSANGGELKYQEILSVAQNANQRTFQTIVISDEDKFFTPQYALNLVLSGAVSTTGNDFIVPITGTKQIYDGGAGDDFILVGGEPGSIVIGGDGFNQIDVVDRQFYSDYDLNHTLSYTRNAAGTFTDINLEYGYSYAYNAAGARIASDRIGSAEAFPNVIGGASHDTITGNRYANRLEGAGGNDILISGRNVADTPLGEDDDKGLTRGDILLGGAGNDILIESALENEPGSLMDGGEGNDTYIVGKGSAIGNRILTTRIVDRTSTGTQNGDDTIKFINDEDSVAIRYTQTGSIINVQLPSPEEDDGLYVGKLVTLDFQSGPGVDNIYRIQAVQRDTQGRALSFDVAASSNVTTPTSGVLIGSDLISLGLGLYWVNPTTAALVDYLNTSPEVMASIGFGQSLITDAGNGYINSLAPVVAQVDRLALDNMEQGSDEYTSGMRYKINFNQGAQNTTEIILSSTNTSSTLFGGQGTDFIYDTVGDDLLIGGDGNDSLYSFFGTDILLGGTGDDQLNFYSNGQIISGGAGADVFQVVGMKFDGSYGNAYYGNVTLITDFNQKQKDLITVNWNWLERITDQGGRYNEITVVNQPFSGAQSYYLSVWTGSTFDDYYLFDLKLPDNGWEATKQTRAVMKSLQEQVLDLSDVKFGTETNDTLYDDDRDILPPEPGHPELPDNPWDVVSGLGGDDTIFISEKGTLVFGGDGNDLIRVEGNGGQILVGGAGSDRFEFAVEANDYNKRLIVDYDRNGQSGEFDSVGLYFAENSIWNTGSNTNGTYAELEVESSSDGSASEFYLDVSNGQNLQRYYLFDLETTDGVLDSLSKVEAVKNDLMTSLMSYGFDTGASVGSAGNDLLADDSGFAQYNKLIGLDGDDVLTTKLAGTQVFGGDGNDMIRVESSGGQILVGGAGSDRFEFAVEANNYNKRLIVDYDHNGQSGEFDSVELNFEANPIWSTYPSTYAELVVQNSDSSSAAGFYLDLWNGQNFQRYYLFDLATGGGDLDPQSKVEAVKNDVINELSSYWIGRGAIVGSDGDNTLDDSNYGYNSLIGLDGNDVLTTRLAGTQVFGGDGNDLIRVESSGGQILVGGAGSDRFEFAVEANDYNKRLIVDYDHNGQNGDIDSVELNFEANPIWSTYPSTYAELVVQNSDSSSAAGFYIDLWNGQNFQRHYLFDLATGGGELDPWSKIEAVKNDVMTQLTSYWNATGAIVGSDGDNEARDVNSYNNLIGLDGDDVLITERQGTRVFGGKGDDDIRVESNDGQELLGGNGQDSFLIKIKNDTFGLAKIMDFDFGNDDLMIDFSNIDPDTDISSSGIGFMQDQYNTNTFKFWLDIETTNGNKEFSTTQYGIAEIRDLSSDDANALQFMLSNQLNYFLSV